MPMKKSTKSSSRPNVKSQMEAGWKNSHSDGYSILHMQNKQNSSEKKKKHLKKNMDYSIRQLPHAHGAIDNEHNYSEV